MPVVPKMQKNRTNVDAALLRLLKPMTEKRNQE